MQSYQARLKPGDRVLVTKFAVTHSGTYMGRKQVAHMRHDKGLSLEPLPVFGDGQPLTVRKNGHIPEHLLWKRFNAARKKPSYQLFGNNCEHLSHFLEKGEAQSPQLRGALTGCALGVAATNSMKTNGWAKIAVILGLGYVGAKLAAPEGELINQPG